MILKRYAFNLEVIGNTKPSPDIRCSIGLHHRFIVIYLTNGALRGSTQYNLVCVLYDDDPGYIIFG